MIKYKAGKRIAREKLKALYESVRWMHYRVPDKLAQAYLNSDFAVTAWDGQSLVGAGRAITDGCFNAYLPDIAVHPDYRNQGLGHEIVTRLIELCKDYYNITAVAEDGGASTFFENCGLTDVKKACRKMTPMKI